MDSRESHPLHQIPPHPQHQLQPNVMLGPTSAYNNSAAAHPGMPMINPNMTPTAGAGGFPFNSVPPRQQPKPSSSDVVFDGSPPSSSGMRLSMEPAKKKRGRPRKYTPDGNIALGLSPTPISSSANSLAHADSCSNTAGVASEPSTKRNRGRPPGSGKKQLDALGGIGGVGFTPHVITVKTGEDIASKLMAFSQQGPRTICILSANGAICNVTLCQPAVLGGIVTYEGRFEIISLSGSFMVSDNNDSRRPGGLSVSLAGPDGRVYGGGVAGILTAASPVQIIVGSFVAEGKKSNSAISKLGPSSAPSSQMLNFGVPMASSPPSQGASSESSDENGSSPLNRDPRIYSNPNQPLHGMNMYHPQLWAQNPH